MGTTGPREHTPRTRRSGTTTIFWSGTGRLRARRQAKNIAARDLASRAGVSAAYLSRLETGKISPTISTLTKIMQALGEPVAVLFGAEDTGPVVRATDRDLVRSHGVEDYRVTPSSAARLQVLETRVAPGGGSGKRPYGHPGDEECIVILDGALTVWLADTGYELGPGDAITFACRTPHRWANHGEHPTRALWIITPASY